MLRTLLLLLGLAALGAAMTLNLEPETRFASSVKIDTVMSHLTALENIASTATGNRAVNTTGFNRTLDYITGYLAANTNFVVTKRFFTRGNFQLLRNPTLISTINNVVKTHTYSTNLAVADFYQVQYSGSVTQTSNVMLTAIPNLGCSDDDWLAARPSPAGLVALVKRGDCTFEEKGRIAARYGVAALLIYNDGRATDGTRPIYVNLGTSNRVPALFLSYALGESLVAAANDPSRQASVRMSIATAPLDSVGNICADTPTGDPTQTILIGSHSDSVTAGPGINDNGTRMSSMCAVDERVLHLL